MCFLAVIFVQLKRRPPSRREFKKGRRKRNLRWQSRSQCVWFQQAWTKGNPLPLVGKFPISWRIRSWIRCLSMVPRATAGGTLSKTESKTQKRVLKCGITVSNDLRETGALPMAPCLTVLKEPRETACGSMSKATWLQVQGIAWNGNERLKSNYRRPGWTTIICKSQIMGTLRRSSRNCVENWIELRMMRCLTWSSTNWSGRLFMSTTMKSRNSSWTGIWSKFDPMPEHELRRNQVVALISLWGWLRKIHSKFWIYLRWCTTSLRGWAWHCAMIKRSNGRKQGCMIILVQSCVLEEYINFLKQTPGGKNRFSIFHQSNEYAKLSGIEMIITFQALGTAAGDEARTELDYHILQISDNRYLEKVFHNCSTEVESLWGRPDICSRSQCIVMKMIIDANNDESSSTSWTKLQWTFCYLQEHQLRCAQDVVWHHAEVALEWEARDSECFHDWVALYSLDEIYFATRRSNKVGEKQRYTCTQTQLSVWDRCRSVQKPGKSGKISFNISKSAMDKQKHP